MKISIVQNDIVWGKPEENRRSFEKLIREAEKSDVYVLPEMFSTGFATEPEGMAETDGATLAWMQRLAAELDAAVCGSLAVGESRVASASHADVLSDKGDVAYYNRLYFVKPDGSYAFYDKHHLFTYGGEHNLYTRGDERVVVEFRGVKFLLQICYDLRFPVFVRNNKEEKYDVIMYVASWAVPRIGVWNTLVRARAIENQCYVAAVNRIGRDEGGEYDGSSVIIDAYGRVAAECPLSTAAVATAEIDIERLKAFRKKFPVLGDAD